LAPVTDLQQQRDHLHAIDLRPLSITADIVEEDTRMLGEYGDLIKPSELMLDTINEDTKSYDPRLARLGLNTQLLWIIDGSWARRYSEEKKGPRDRLTKTNNSSTEAGGNGR